MTQILVVDDVLTDRRLAGGLLSKQSEYEVLYASNGLEALEQFDLHRPALVLTDLQMPDFDGLQLVDALKQRSPATPVVLMTAKGSEETAIEAIARGAASYVPKKALARDLLETVGRVLAEADQSSGDRLLLNHLEEISYHLENDQRLIAAIVSQVRRVFHAHQFLNDSDSLRASGAIDEALQNAYYHGNLEVDSKLRELADNSFHRLANERRQQDPYRRRKIKFSMKLAGDEARVTIADEGPGFDVRAVPDPTDPEFFERPHGRGVFLMRAFMDVVRFNSRGNEVTLVKRRSEAVADDAAPSSE